MNTPEQNIIATLKGKKVLFLEGDNSLENGLEEFEAILKRGDIEYTLFFNIEEKELSDITTAINNHDCIVFMTQWVYDISKTLSEYMFSLQDKKIVIEAYITEPTWYYTPKNTIHDVYIYSCMMCWGEPLKDNETFYKLSDNAYWNYENKFDC